MSEPVDILRSYWGHDGFRPLQSDIIDSVIDGNDTLALLPTGGGKSICFQVPALALEGICIVVSPLIALMKDQVQNLKDRNIKAVSVTSELDHKQIDALFDRCIYEDIKFLYLSPERLNTELAKVRIAQMNVAMIAVDEAHCISEWGYDFRPSYLNIAAIREI
ncbi:MAG: DEAD/DEAH box helicase, partial [Bacteroidetes bacterium]|nr:DEAD/DEAH box helicase [Bacteroidota bacterium]